MSKSGVTTTTQTKFIALLQKVFHELGEKYNPVRITSSYRSHGWQSEYLVNYSGTWSKYPGTEPLLLFCRDIVDGTLTQEHIKNVRDGSVVDAPLLTRIKALQNSDALFSGGYIQRIQYKNPSIFMDVLEAIFKVPLYRPSEHPYGKCFDLHKNNSGISIYGNHKGSKYEEGNFKHIEYS